jgi:hypothetical protein
MAFELAKGTFAYTVNEDSACIQYDTKSLKVFRLANIGRLHLYMKHSTKREKCGQDSRYAGGQVME